MAKRLTWRREADEKGLRGVVQGERGFDLRYDGAEVGTVRPRYDGWSRKRAGYYWTAQSANPPVPLINTAGTPVATIEEAKAQCEAYVREHLGLPPRKPPKDEPGFFTAWDKVIRETTDD
mgnify:CR=1 FL=1